MIQKKVCMVGVFGTGKTSLVQRFVHSMFSERYLSTVGVKIERKPLELDGTTLTLVLWDLASPPVPSPADVGYLLFPVLALEVILGRQDGRLRRGREREPDVLAAEGVQAFGQVVRVEGDRDVVPD